ncbi:SMI1/KNR4 family protein [Phragmitibacter flavus]|uniref:SMI1/KNR4 family protein n=1 Tax=Phragmitibacter flavus TaxID=2576071 RepID=A0A5R8KH60_9BACT|nr:SMI1/KNR4 family protein [Phragmitibacter flavus]TLD71654.1 SMI1/KNR4 family protein [Phragmitibacter flavus]
MLDPRIEPATPFTQTDITSIEQFLGRTLPEDYRVFACEYGGAFVGGLVDGNVELPILAFFGADVVISKLEIHADLRGDCVLPIADCELGNLYVIDRENSLHFINYYGGRTTSRKVADTFSDLLARIVISDE